MTEIIHKNESYAIIGACFEVYNERGCGFLEPVYRRARKRKPMFPMSLSNVFASIRVIRGLI